MAIPLKIVDGTQKRPEWPTGADTEQERKELNSWITKAAKAQPVVVSRLSEEVLVHVLSCESAAEIWTKLQTVYEHKSDTSVLLTQQQFLQLKCSDTMDCVIIKERPREYFSQLCDPADTGEASPRLSFPNSDACLFYVMCNPPKEACYMQKCSECPKTEDLCDVLKYFFEKIFIDTVTYKQWMQVDRCSLETIIKSADLFCEEFAQAIPGLLQHEYIVRKQALHLKDCKRFLKEDKVIVIADFSENYSFVLNYSPQGVHWINEQATVHPFACYYRPAASENTEVKPLNLVVISDCLQHVTSTVSAFQKVLMDFLKSQIPGLSKVLYFSDGSAAQYKNRFNMANLAHHQSDYRMAATWSFFGISHGKGPCDGLGGTLKRLAARASLPLPYQEQIQTPLDLFQWANQNVSGMHFVFVPKTEVDTQAKKLSSRFSKAVPIEGIRSMHFAEVRNGGVLAMKRHTYAESESLFTAVMESTEQNAMEESYVMVTRSRAPTKRRHL